MGSRTETPLGVIRFLIYYSTPTGPRKRMACPECQINLAFFHRILEANTQNRHHCEDAEEGDVAMGVNESVKDGVRV